MEPTENETGTNGDEVMKSIGELKQVTKDLEEATKESETDPEEVGNWITTIGKAILAIFK